MATYQIRQGRNIKLKGAASREIIQAPLPSCVAVQPPDFRGLKPRVLVKAGDSVKVGTPVLTDKVHEEFKVTSPVSGKVKEIVRGEKRVLLAIVITSDGKQDVEPFHNYLPAEIKDLSRQQVMALLLEGGLWPVIRQRPFSHFASPKDTPKAVFIHAMNTEPLAADVDFILEKREEEFRTGLDVLKKLTKGNVHLCVSAKAKSKALTQAYGGIQIHKFTGPHPAGNVSTHIHNIDPIHKGDIVWYVEAQDVLRIAALFLKGTCPTERIVAVTGEGAAKRVYVKTVVGAPLSSLLEGSNLSGMRCLSGSVLTGKDVGPEGFVRFYDSQVTVIPRGGQRKLLGWLSPGFDKYTFSRTFVSSFLPQREVSMDTDENGSHRAIVMNHIYDGLVPLDIMTYFLIKAVLAGEIEEAERLGILECDEEDFALCSFACPSKTDVGGIIGRGLALIEREG